MDYKRILYEKFGRVVRLTINRPEAMNAIDVQTWVDLGHAFRAFAEDDEAWALVLTGAGEKSFCAGADLKAVARGEMLQIGAEMKSMGFGGLVRQYTDKPVIAAVNGYALGGGTEFAIFCDLIVAADSATFGLPEVKRGLVAAGGGLLRLPRQLPLKVAMKMIMTGEPMSAQEALRWGLVNEVVPVAQVVSTAMALAEKVCACSPISVRSSKRVVHRSLLADLEIPGIGDGGSAWVLSDEAAAHARASEDAKEGPQAFAEKRAPVWKGR